MRRLADSLGLDFASALGRASPRDDTFAAKLLLDLVHPESLSLSSMLMPHLVLIAWHQQESGSRSCDHVRGTGNGSHSRKVSRQEYQKVLMSGPNS
ncbi:unnamed protein product [Protopolystoma xenopodis]|uniref:Uncharacterized protein n=1 Tax=Protopolystoma xenopodis TaxID=117903 RepID=A0A448WPM9_9PLAT|nr:unnamed protein product [Protopolystoma xenopodis]